MQIQEKIEETPITGILSSNFLDYSMSVIVSRAIPDVRDGLKPVHRRILWAMKDLGMNYNRPFKKSARIVGEVIGKYHPHGDTAVYDSMVRLTQNWNVRTPLVDGQGNFGSIDGDSAAAMRYTEARLKKVAHELLRDITDEKGKLTGVVDFVPNFDGEEQEPSVLPSRLPNLLINGSEGIAVGMATKMAPHNLQEVCEAIIAQMKNPDIEVEELMEYIKGPDFPTGSTILGTQGIKESYETGRGSLLIRGVIEQDVIDGRDALIIKEIPYQVNKLKLITSIKQIQKDYNEYKNELRKKAAKKLEQKGIDFIHDIRDETSNENKSNEVRIVIELKNGTNPDLVLNYLYKHTSLQTSFSIINLALVPKKFGDNQQRLEPKVLGLKNLIAEYIKHQQEVTKRKLLFDLNEKEVEMHRLVGIKKALEKLDEALDLIRNSKEDAETKEGLKSLLDIDDTQAEQILRLRLRRLANYEQDKLLEQYNQLEIEITKIKEILSSEEKLNDIITEDLKAMIEEYGEERLTKIGPSVDSINDEDLVEDIEVVVTMTHNGLIKRIPETTYRTQRRNGRGINGIKTFEDDFVTQLQIANNLDTLMFFTNEGNVYKIKAYQIPMTSSQSQGVSVKSIFDLNPEEEIQSILSIKKFTDQQYVVFGTKHGFSKRTKLSEYADSRRNGIRAITFKDEKDEVMHVGLTNGERKITVITKKGQTITFKEENVKVVKRNAGGVKVISLDKDDEVVSMAIHDGFSQLFMATNNGFGKRTPLSEFRTQKRAGKGVRGITTNEKNGFVIGCCVIEEDENLLLLTKNGTIIKMKVSEVSSFGRNAQGTKLINLKEDDQLIAIDRNSDEELLTETPTPTETQN